MVSAAENRSRVWCSPVSEPEPGPSPGWVTSTVRIERTAELPETANLMAEATGREYTALVPPAFAGELATTRNWVVDVEVVGPHRIAVRDVAQDD